MKYLTKKRAILVGMLIILAYSMLTYDITGNEVIGFIADEVSGLAVIGIALLMYPIFALSDKKLINYIYFASRLIEGLLMVMGGCFIIFGNSDSIRGMIYSNIHIWFFIVGALTFYYLLYLTKAVPRYIAVWGLVASALLIPNAVFTILGLESTFLGILVLPMILNELYLAIRLIIKGFVVESESKFSQ